MGTERIRSLAGRQMRLLAGLVRRRPLPAGEHPITYGGRLKPMLITVVVVSAVELAVVELLVPWSWLRWTLLVLGCYGLLWVAAFARAMAAHPHGVDDGALHLRYADSTEVTVPLRTLVGAGESLASHDETVEVADGVLAVSVAGVTNVVLTLDPPVPVDAGGAGVHEVGRVRFYAHHPAEAVTRLRASVASKK